MTCSEDLFLFGQPVFVQVAQFSSSALCRKKAIPMFHGILRTGNEPYLEPVHRVLISSQEPMDPADEESDHEAHDEERLRSQSITNLAVQSTNLS